MRNDIPRLVDEQVLRSSLRQRAALEIAELAEIIEQEPGPVITISRQLGSGGRLVAERLAERLGWALWDRELVDAIASDAAVSRRIVETFDEKVVTDIEMLARTISGDPEAGSFLYHRHLLHALLAIARRGRAIILGRGANFMLKDALNVRILASEGRRIENVMEWEHVSRREAQDMIHHSDRERAEFIRRVFDRNVDDPLAYELTIVADHFSIPGAVDVILAALEIGDEHGWRVRTHYVGHG